MSSGHMSLRVCPRGYVSRGGIYQVGICPWDKCPGVHGWGVLSCHSDGS